MITKLTMPRLSETTSTGTISAWLVNEGEKVAKGAPLLEVETDKATVEVESPTDGYLGKILYGTGLTVEARTVIALIVDEMSEDLMKHIPGDVPGNSLLSRSTRDEHAVDEPVLRKESRRPSASPMAARLAKEKGVELANVEGTGPDGRITKADVLKAASRNRELGGKSVAKVIPLTRMRKAIAQSTVESKRLAPHGYVLSEVDMSKVLAYRERLDLETLGSEPASCSFTDILIKAVSIALRDFPWLNSSLSEEGLILWKDINIGFVVSLGDEGLLVPVVHHADRKSVAEIACATHELVMRARRRKIGLEDCSDGTFTISNLGMYGIDTFIAVINPRQSAILAVGKIARRPYVIGEEVRAVPLMKLALSSDHRVIDGVLAAKFLGRLDAILQNPETLDATDNDTPILKLGNDVSGTAEQET